MTHPSPCSPSGCAHALLVTAWGNALLAGRVSPDALADALAPLVHRVVAADDSQPVPVEGAPSLTYALTRLRAAGVRRLLLVLPAPGDVTGLPGPVTFNELAIEAGAAILVPAASLGLLPHQHEGLVVWTAHPVAEHPAGGDGGARSDERSEDGTAEVRPAEVRSAEVRPAEVRSAEVRSAEVRTAERELSMAIARATEELAARDVAGATAEQATGLADVRRAQVPSLPPGHPPEAVHLVLRARRLLGVVELATRAEGSAHSAAAMRARGETIHDLERAARHALAVAISS